MNPFDPQPDGSGADPGAVMDQILAIEVKQGQAQRFELLGPGKDMHILKALKSGWEYVNE